MITFCKHWRFCQSDFFMQCRRRDNQYLATKRRETPCSLQSLGSVVQQLLDRSICLYVFVCLHMPQDTELRETGWISSKLSCGFYWYNAGKKLSPLFGISSFTPVPLSYAYFFCSALLCQFLLSPNSAELPLLKIIYLISCLISISEYFIKPHNLNWHHLLARRIIVLS